MAYSYPTMRLYLGEIALLIIVLRQTPSDVGALKINEVCVFTRKCADILHNLQTFKSSRTQGLRPQGVRGVKNMWEIILKDLIELRKMLKTALKHIVPNSSYDFLKFAIRL